MRTKSTKKTTSSAKLLAQYIVAKADVAQLKARIHIADHKGEYKVAVGTAGATAGVMSLVQELL